MTEVNTEINIDDIYIGAQLATSAYDSVISLQSSSLADEYFIKEGHNENGDVIHIFEDKKTGQSNLGVRGTDSIDDYFQFDEIGRGEMTDLGAAVISIVEQEYERSGMKVNVFGYSGGGNATELAKRMRDDMIDKAINLQGQSVMDDGEEISFFWPFFWRNDGFTEYLSKRICEND